MGSACFSTNTNSGILWRSSGAVYYRGRSLLLLGELVQHSQRRNETVFWTGIGVLLVFNTDAYLFAAFNTADIANRGVSI